MENFAPKLEFSDLTEKGLQTLVDYLLSLKNERYGEKIKLRNTTIKKDINILKWFLRWATAKGYNKEMSFVTLVQN